MKRVPERRKKGQVGLISRNIDDNHKDRKIESFGSFFKIGVCV